MPGEILPRVLVLLFLFANLAAVTFLETIKNLVLRLLNLNVPSEKKKKVCHVAAAFIFYFLVNKNWNLKDKQGNNNNKGPNTTRIL